MKTIKHWFLKSTEGVAAAMLAAMFLIFVLQIFSRHILEAPLGWTLEALLTLWVWMIFWGNSFVVRHREQVTFDVFYLAVGPRVRKVFALVTAAAIIIGMGATLLPTWDYIDFLKIKDSATLRIPMRTVFSIYGVFIVAVVIYYIIRFVRIWRHGAPEDRAKQHVGDI